MDTMYGIPLAEIKDIVSAFVSLPGIEIVHEINLKTLFELWPEKVPDYGDAIIAAICHDNRGASIATFDRKFKSRLKQLGLPTSSFDKT